MPIKEVRCPECGVDVTLGIPQGGTVKSVTTEAEPEPTEDQRTTRILCPNDHEMVVSIEL
jgi:hypothetical protein